MARTERKRNDDINDIFSTFDEEFEEMRARMDKMMEEMLTGQSGLDEESKCVRSIDAGSGRTAEPHIQEFGNVKPLAPCEEERRAHRTNPSWT